MWKALLGLAEFLGKERGVKKQQGCTWIELNNEVHTFVVHNQNHPRMIDIHAELKRLSGLMHDVVHVPSMKFVLHNVEEDEKVVHLCHHSKKTDYCIHTDQHSSLYSTPKYEICGFVKIAMLPQSSIQKYLAEQSWSSNYISEVPLIVLHQLLGAVVALIHMEKLSQLMEILALAKIFCLRIIARMRQMS
ncbi:unnamed protein product [Sphagnum jensenii]|uniref:Uncharacterized protein n=1 Tax=Sphagnum jensenii TaxID=128206 RepID=A0ABP1BCK5_9BRYO